MELCGPSLPPEFFKLCAARKDESLPFIWNSLKQLDCFMLLERVVKYINILKRIFMIYGLFRKLCLFKDPGFPAF